MATAEATALATLLSDLEPVNGALRMLLDDLTREPGIDLNAWVRFSEVRRYSSIPQSEPGLRSSTP
jgi:hypothetical protein